MLLQVTDTFANPNSPLVENIDTACRNNDISTQLVGHGLALQLMLHT